MILGKGQSACEAVGSGGMSPESFSALRLNVVAILTYHLTGCPPLLASNKVYHFSKNLIKVYFVYSVTLNSSSVWTKHYTIYGVFTCH